MFRKWTSLDDLKRMIYLWTIPFIVISLFIYYHIHPHLVEHESFYKTSNLLFIVWLVLNWICNYIKRYVLFFEYTNLIFLSAYYLILIHDWIFDYTIHGNSLDIVLFIFSTPFMFLYLFLVLQPKRGFIFSLILLVIPLLTCLHNSDVLTLQYSIPLILFFTWNSIYIGLLYFSKQIMKAYNELRMINRLSYIDVLTGIANRRQIDTWFMDLIDNANQHQIGFSILFFDIDHFKKINDVYGHMMGDYILREVAQSVSSYLSENESFGRWGGEEFIILTQKSALDTIKLAEKIRQVIESHPFDQVGTVTSSFGVASYQPGDTIDTLFHRADKGLYLSKTNGRNQVNMIETLALC